MHRRIMVAPRERTLAVLLIAGLTLLAPMPARAAGPTSYAFQPLAQIGGMAGDIPIPKGLTWFLGPLNDNGQFLVDAGTISGTQTEILLQYSDGKFTPLVTSGMDGPVGPWPKEIGIVWPFSMNGRGDTVFQVVKLAGLALIGTFLHDAQTGKTTPVVLKGMPATGNLTFTDASTFSPTINNHDDIALTGGVGGGGAQSGSGLFFRTPDGALQPILVPGQALPDGKKGPPTFPSITDAGVVAFLVGTSAYLWENGSLAPMVTVGATVPGGGKIAAVSSVHLNNQNSSALISVVVAGAPGHGLYRAAAGTLTAVAVVGQPMSGGANFKSITSAGNTDLVSTATEVGQHAFVATLDDNSQAVYRLDADGTLSLVVKTGMSTPLGKFTHFGPYAGAAMNSMGQVLISASFDNGPETLVLLTPAAP